MNSKNIWQQYARIFGVEYKEAFNLEGKENNYRFGDTGLETFYDGEWYHVPELELNVLRGETPVVKKPWKPELDQIYYNIFFIKNNEKPIVAKDRWRGHSTDYAAFALGNCFRTHEEAAAHMEEIVEKYEKAYDNIE